VLVHSYLSQHASTPARQHASTPAGSGWWLLIAVPSSPAAIRPMDRAVDQKAVLRRQKRDLGRHASGRLLVGDRGPTPAHNNIVIAVLEGELTVKRLGLHGNHVELHPANLGLPCDG
jgi:hypothetical protein